MKPLLLASQAHSLESKFWTCLLVSEGRTVVPCGRQRQTLSMAQTWIPKEIKMSEKNFTVFYRGNSTDKS